jgi:hypothetical protein
MASRDNLLSVKTFFQRYPERAHNDFYLASESYGGHYIPQWTLQVLNDEHTRVHFKGYMLGELTCALQCGCTCGWTYPTKLLANVCVIQSSRLCRQSFYELRCGQHRDGQRAVGPAAGAQTSVVSCRSFFLFLFCGTAHSTVSQVYRAFSQLPLQPPHHGLHTVCY